MTYYDRYGRKQKDNLETYCLNNNKAPRYGLFSAWKSLLSAAMWTVVIGVILYCGIAFVDMVGDVIYNQLNSILLGAGL